LHCQIAKRLKIVDRASVDGPGVADHAGRLKAGGAVALDCRGKRVEVDAEIIPGRDALKRAVSEPHRLDRFAMAVMDLIRGIES
jgi:hypothetical protein